MILLLLRLTAQASHALVIRIILGVTAALGLVSFLLAALVCDLKSPWIFIGEQCSGIGARWDAIAAFDIVTELAVIAGLFFVMYDVQLRRRKKLAVILGFAFRLL